MRPPRTHLRSRAFTLIEVIVVVVIIAVLVAIAAVGYLSVTNNAKDSATNTRMHQIVKIAAASAATKGSGVASYDAVNLAEFKEAVNGLPPLALGSATADPQADAAPMDVVSGPSTGPTVLSVEVDPGDTTVVGLALRSPTGKCVRAKVTGIKGDVGTAFKTNGPECSGAIARTKTTTNELSNRSADGTELPPADAPLAAPTGVTALAGQPESTDVRVSWPAVPGATSYRLYLDGATDPAATVTTLTADLEALTNGSHKVTVTAVRGAEESPASAEVPFTITIVSNDMVANATKFTPPASGQTLTINAKSTGATMEPGEIGGYGASVWWKFTPKVTSAYYLSVPYNYHDLRIVEAPDVTATGNYNGNHQPTLNQVFTAGKTYWIRIGGGGDFPWTITAGPDNDFIDNAAVLALPAGGTTKSVTVNATYATMEAGEIGGYGASVWYKMTPAYDTSVFINVPYNYHDLRITEVKDVTANGTYNPGHQPALSKSLEAGKTYWIRIGGGGAFTWTIKAGPENDSISNATAVAAPAVGETKRTAGVDGSQATTQTGELVVNYGQSLWWKFSPSVTGSYTVAVEGNYKDLRIVDTPDVTAVGWYNPNHYPSLTNTFQAGKTYYIRIGTSNYPTYDWAITRNS